MVAEAMVYLKALADGFETVVVCPEALDHDLTLESQFVLDPDEVQQDLSVQTGPMAPGAATSYSYPSEPTPQACLLRRCDLLELGGFPGVPTLHSSRLYMRVERRCGGSHRRRCCISSGPRLITYILHAELRTRASMRR